MKKPCTLADVNLAEQLAPLPEKLCGTPLSYALLLTARNTLKDKSEQLAAKAIAEQANQRFPNIRPPLTAQNLGKAVKHPLTFVQPLLDWSEQYDQNSEEFQLLTDTPSPDILNQMNPALAKATLAFMEVTAHVRGDTETSHILRSINAELNHDPGYKNPFIQAMETPAMVQQQISNQLLGWRQQGKALWSNVNQVADQAKTVGHLIAQRAKQDWSIVQAATYMPEITQQPAEVGMETRVAMLEQLKAAASRS